MIVFPVVLFKWQSRERARSCDTTALPCLGLTLNPAGQHSRRHNMGPPPDSYDSGAGNCGVGIAVAGNPALTPHGLPTDQDDEAREATTGLPQGSPVETAKTVAMAFSRGRDPKTKRLET